MHTTPAALGDATPAERARIGTRRASLCAYLAAVEPAGRSAAAAAAVLDLRDDGVREHVARAAVRDALAFVAELERLEREVREHDARRELRAHRRRFRRAVLRP